MTQELLLAGSKKLVFATDKPGQLALCFTDQVSVFGRGPMPWRFTGAGRILCQTSSLTHRLLQRCGISTHYRGGVSGDVTTMLVDACRIDELKFYPEQSYGRILPITCLWQNKLSEKVYELHQMGTLLTEMSKPYFCGPFNDVKAGMWLGRPFPYFSTNFELEDRYLTYEDAMKWAGLDEVQFIKLLDLVVRVAGFLKNWFGQVGFDCLEGKLKIAIDDHGNFFLTDCVTPDGLRLWGRNDNKSYDISLLHRYFEEHFPDWVAELRRQKKLCPNRPDCWTPYPIILPETERVLVQALVGRYYKVLEALRKLPSLEA